MDGEKLPIQIGRAGLKGHAALRHREFAYVKEHGARLAGRYVALNLAPAPDGHTRLGIIVSRRCHRQAVKRNRARRLIRETFRLLRHGINTPVWLVIIARQAAVASKLQELQAEFIQLLTRAEVFCLPSSS